ncbi:origin recognition complex subunit 1 [Colletes gigas]|uniref:origin recognition complex subunit 1 n=1 Tax=Colletes gigas TaxID=935657 RepID=UPI001C9B9A12|nr:origin recognition complex subunit 1 [Colletes gigas]
MATKLNKYCDNQIVALLNSQSDSNSNEEVNMAPNKLKRSKRLKLRNTEHNTSDVSSDIENIEEDSNLQKERVQLRIKLRRSTEQSLYKIDKSFNKYKGTSLKSNNKCPKQKTMNYSEEENRKDSSGNEDSSGESKVKDKNKLVQIQNENEVLTRTRNRKPPLRLASYHCGPLNRVRDTDSPGSPSSRRNRKSVNYNEDKLFINAIMSNLKVDDKQNTQMKTENKDVSTDKSNLESRTVRTNVRSTKQNCIPSVKDDKNDCNTDSEITKTKSIKKSNQPESKIDDKLKKETAKESDLLDTPIRKNKHKRVINMKGNEVVGNSTDDGKIKILEDTIKHTEIPSTAINLTPVRTDKKRKMKPEDTLQSVHFVNNTESNSKEEDLIDMYKRTKISLSKKNILTPQRRNNAQKDIQKQLEEVHLSTPKSRPIKCSTLTPSMRERHGTLMKPATPLQEARSRLHVSAVPKSLPCREEEFNNIFTFLKGKLEDKSGGCMYISGVPGTGKTATVNEAVRCLQKLTSKGQLDDFNYVAINGMKLTEPRQAYVQILKQLEGRSASWEQAYQILEKTFHRAHSKMTLLLVDELDFVCTKRQDVVYNLLDWPSKATAHLIVLTIANTMDLPERVLMGRVTSRLGLTRLTFQPYNYKQLQEIVMYRLRDFTGFRSEAIQLVARKVSAVSGDARRALDICRRAMEIAESRNEQTISLQDVSEAVSEMIASAKVQAIKHCSKMEQILLQAVSAEVTRTSIEEVYFYDAYRQLQALCSFNGLQVPAVTEVLAICVRLGASRLLICEHSRKDIYQKILLNVSTDDIHYAIQEIDFISK